MESGESYLACVKKQKSEKLLSSEQCTWCLSTVENFWYKTVWKEFAANQHFQLLCIGQRQSSGALTSGKPGWNFISDILENPSLVILILIYTVTTRWLGLKTEKSLATQVFIENKILFFLRYFVVHDGNTNHVKMAALTAVWSLSSMVLCFDSIF